MNLIKELIQLENEEYKRNLQYINKNLPEQCESCSFFIVTNLNKHKVYCPYMIKDRCILK